MYVRIFGENRHLAYLQNLEIINETATPLLKFQSRLLLLTDQWRNMYSVVDDLATLKNGVEMYSITHDEVVLFVVLCCLFRQITGVIPNWLCTREVPLAIFVESA